MCYLLILLLSWLCKHTTHIHTHTHTHTQSDNDELNKTLPPNFRFHHHHSYLSPSSVIMASSPSRISPIRSSELSSHQRSRTSTSSLQRRQPVARNQRPNLSRYARNKEKGYMGKSDPAIARNVSTCDWIWGLSYTYLPNVLWSEMKFPHYC